MSELDVIKKNEKIKTMKKIKLALVLIFILNITQQLLAQTVTIDGFTYLENQVILRKG